VTAIRSTPLDESEIDGAPIATASDEDLRKAQAFLARSLEELIENTGSIDSQTMALGHLDLRSGSTSSPRRPTRTTSRLPSWARLAGSRESKRSGPSAGGTVDRRGGLLGWDERKAFESLERRFDPDTARFVDETDHAGVRDDAEPPRAGPPNRTTRALLAPSDRRLAADSDEVIVSGNGR
jgi:hypothetical protein